MTNKSILKALSKDEERLSAEVEHLEREGYPVTAKHVRDTLEHVRALIKWYTRIEEGMADGTNNIY